MLSEPHEQRGPVRTCVGCREASAADELVRLVLAPDGSVAVDLTGGAFGRGAWIHARPRCIAAASPRGLARSWKTEVRATQEAVLEALRVAADRRIIGLIRAATGAKKLAIGSTAVAEAIERGRAALLVVARDARAAAESREVQVQVAKGLVIAWGTKTELGAATHREETAILGVLDAGLARALKQAILLTQVPDGQRQNAGGDASTEE